MAMETRSICPTTPADRAHQRLVDELKHHQAREHVRNHAFTAHSLPGSVAEPGMDPAEVLTSSIGITLPAELWDKLYWWLLEHRKEAKTKKTHVEVCFGSVTQTFIQLVEAVRVWWTCHYGPRDSSIHVPADAHFVLGIGKRACDNDLNYHQDRFHGLGAFVKNGSRNLITIKRDIPPTQRSSQSDTEAAGVPATPTPDSRVMAFRRKGDHMQLFATDAPTTVMNAAAAGAGGCSNVEHGRLDDGITLAIDVLELGVDGLLDSTAVIHKRVASLIQGTDTPVLTAE